METPSEWAKRFNRETAGEAAGSPKPEAEASESSNPVVEFPTEPFPCPACGQMLAPSCRVCVACRHAIDPAQFARPQEAVAVALAAPAPEEKPATPPVRFPWALFGAVLGVEILVALICLQLWGEEKARWVLWGLQTLASIWVFFDALRRRIPQPWRWGVGSLLLPVLIFPWYLARRRQPESPCPFVEAKSGPVTRFIIIALIIFFVMNAVSYVVMGPPAK
jgi:hypothetical protein